MKAWINSIAAEFGRHGVDPRWIRIGIIGGVVGVIAAIIGVVAAILGAAAAITAWLGLFRLG